MSDTSQPRTWLVTGAAGFIGMHTALRLLERGDTVIGVDNLNNETYYAYHPMPMRTLHAELQAKF